MIPKTSLKTNPCVGILVELPLAGFFLKKFRGMYCDIGDLPTLDPQLYKSLMFLKRCAGQPRGGM